MSCLWKKNPAAPCSCAYRLEARMVEILNHLSLLGPATIVLRREGLSLAKTTSFGLSLAYGEKDWSLLHDRISGLETDTGVPQDIHLLTTASDPRPLLLLGKPGSSAELSIRLDSQAWGSPLMRGMIRRFHGTPLHCLESRRLGAGAWLDEWENNISPLPDRATIREACGIVASSGKIEVEIRTAAYRNISGFSPAFVDHDGPVLKIADARCRHVVYADTTAPGFSLTRKPNGTTLLSRGKVGDRRSSTIYHPPSAKKFPDFHKF